MTGRRSRVRVAILRAPEFTPQNACPERRLDGAGSPLCDRGGCSLPKASYSVRPIWPRACAARPQLGRRQKPVLAWSMATIDLPAAISADARGRRALSAAGMAALGRPSPGLIARADHSTRIHACRSRNLLAHGQTAG